MTMRACDMAMLAAVLAWLLGLLPWRGRNRLRTESAMKARWYVAVVAGTLMAMATTAAWSRLKPEHRETLDLAADLESSLNAVEQSAHVMLGQVERARNGLKQRSTGYTVKELAALQESCDTMSKRIKDAEQALKKLDDGRLEPDAGAVTNSGVP